MQYIKKLSNCPEALLHILIKKYTSSIRYPCFKPLAEHPRPSPVIQKGRKQGGRVKARNAARRVQP